MKFLDLFAGIGGFRLGMEATGHKCIGFCEIDKFARASYKAIHNTKGEIELHDITRVTDDEARAIGPVDVICGGFPCQAFSIAGARRGFEDTRGTLCTRNIFPIGRESQSISSQSVVKIGNVNPSGNGMNGEVYQADGLAPTLTTNKGEGQKIAIPVLTPDRAEKRQNGRRFKTDGEPMFTLTAQDRHGVVVENEIKKFGTIEPNFNQSGVVYETDGIAPTIRAYQGGGLEPKIIQRGHGYNQGGEHDIAPTLTSNSYHENNHLSDGYRIRKLTPRECWRLQGFPDWAFDKAQEVNSNSQLYKQAGNSVTVNVIEAIARELV